jgi:hypothetical protein
MNKILKGLLVITCAFCFANMQMQAQVNTSKSAQQKVTDKNLAQILVLLEEINGTKNQSNFSIGKELILIGASGGIAFGIIYALAKYGFLGEIAGIPASNSSLISVVFHGMTRSQTSDGVVLGLIALDVWVGTYILLKVLWFLKNKLVNKLKENPSDRETKEKIAKIEKLLEQVKSAH